MTGQISDAERAALPVGRAALEGRASAYGIADSIVFALGSAGLLQTPETAAAMEQLRKGRDAFADRVDTLTAVAQGSRKHVASLLTSLLATEKQVRELKAGPALPWAAAMSDEDLHLFLGDLVSAAMGRWQSDPEVPDRETLADIEKACAQWRTPGQGLRSDAPEEGSERVPAAAELTVYRAVHDESSISLGHYTTRKVAMDHVHAILAREENTTVAVIETRVTWRADDPAADDPEWECCLVDVDTGDDSPTGYVVGPITVTAAYDPDGERP